MPENEAPPCHHYATTIRIVPNEKIVFNWMWKDGVDKTQVTLEFQAKGEEQTLLTLTHRGFSQQEFADKHPMGWNGCLSNLENRMATLE